MPGDSAKDAGHFCVYGASSQNGITMETPTITNELERSAMKQLLSAHPQYMKRALSMQDCILCPAIADDAKLEYMRLMISRYPTSRHWWKLPRKAELIRRMIDAACARGFRAYVFFVSSDKSPVEIIDYKPGQVELNNGQWVTLGQADFISVWPNNQTAPTRDDIPTSLAPRRNR